MDHLPIDCLAHIISFRSDLSLEAWCLVNKTFRSTLFTREHALQWTQACYGTLSVPLVAFQWLEESVPLSKARVQFVRNMVAGTEKECILHEKSNLIHYTVDWKSLVTTFKTTICASSLSFKYPPEAACLRQDELYVIPSHDNRSDSSSVSLLRGLRCRDGTFESLDHLQGIIPYSPGPPKKTHVQYLFSSTHVFALSHHFQTYEWTVATYNLRDCKRDKQVSFDNPFYSRRRSFYMTHVDGLIFIATCDDQTGPSCTFVELLILHCESLERIYIPRYKTQRASLFATFQLWNSRVYYLSISNRGKIDSWSAGTFQE